MSGNDSNSGSERSIVAVAFFVGLVVFPVCLFIWFRFLLRQRDIASFFEQRFQNDSSSGKENTARKKLVKNSLITKKVLSHRQCNSTIASDRNQTLTTDISQDSDPTIIVDKKVETDPTRKNDLDDDGKFDAVEMGCDNYTLCIICLEPYHVGEFVSWCRSMPCCHVFHEDCVVQWLMKKDECPCCRTNWVKCRGTSIASCNQGLDVHLDVEDLEFCKTHGLVMKGCEKGCTHSKILSQNTVGSTTKSSLANLATGPDQATTDSNVDSEPIEGTDPSTQPVAECAQ